MANYEEEIQQLVDTVNDENHELIVVDVFGLAYDLMHAELYIATDAEGEEYPLIMLDLMWVDEANSHECELIVTPQTLQKCSKRITNNKDSTNYRNHSNSHRKLCTFE